MKGRGSTFSAVVAREKRAIQYFQSACLLRKDQSKRSRIQYGAHGSVTMTS